MIATTPRDRVRSEVFDACAAHYNPKPAAFIAGTLLEVGEGRRPSDSFRKILESGERSQVGPTAPGRALWLEQVWYPGIRWNRADR